MTRELKPYKGKTNLPRGFMESVRWLTRPYITITEKQHDVFLLAIDKAGTDFLIDRNSKLFTIGRCDDDGISRCALMSIAEKYLPKIKKEVGK